MSIFQERLESASQRFEAFINSDYKFTGEPDIEMEEGERAEVIKKSPEWVAMSEFLNGSFMEAVEAYWEKFNRNGNATFAESIEIVERPKIHSVQTEDGSVADKVFGFIVRVDMGYPMPHRIGDTPSDKFTFYINFGLNEIKKEIKIYKSDREDDVNKTGGKAAFEEVVKTQYVRDVMVGFDTEYTPDMTIDQFLDYIADSIVSS